MVFVQPLNNETVLLLPITMVLAIQDYLAAIAFEYGCDIAKRGCISPREAEPWPCHAYGVTRFAMHFTHCYISLRAFDIPRSKVPNTTVEISFAILQFLKHWSQQAAVYPSATAQAQEPPY